jgi:SAM-dependent methyltransferase
MAIGPDAVRWAYRLLLDREAENDQVIEAYSHTADVPTLRRIFLNSAEYSQRNRDGSQRASFAEIASTPVQVEASEAEIGAMMDRIAQEWRRFGETEPHWSVLTSEIYKAENIGRTIDGFYDSAQQDLKKVFNQLGRAGVPTARFGRVLDFGCGVGRLSLAFASRADRVLGVDISPPHLRLARERAAQKSVTNVEFMAIDAPSDLDRLSGFDLIVSLIVLQHNPPPVMAILLEKLLRALAPGGTAVIQMPTYLRDYRFSVADYLSNAQPAMEMNALPQAAVFAIAARAGCHPIEVREDDYIGALEGISQTFAFVRPA